MQFSIDINTFNNFQVRDTLDKAIFYITFKYDNTLDMARCYYITTSCKYVKRNTGID